MLTPKKAEEITSVNAALASRWSSTTTGDPDGRMVSPNEIKG
tara:strand:+ start:447 stop:572 length:126 start_codon:yes stop_codon:yes gene_type:complete